MPESESYTIAEAAALCGVHKNTVRTRIRLGQLEASVVEGRFGEEYRLSRDALVRGGLLPGESAADSEPFRPHDTVSRPQTCSPAPPEPAAENTALAAALEGLRDLYQRHEQAMFRLGYLQAELEQVKALAASAESLREASQAREQEVRDLQTALEESARQAEELERLRVEKEKLDEELRWARQRLQQADGIRRDLEELKTRHDTLVYRLENPPKRPWWRFGRG